MEHLTFLPRHSLKNYPAVLADSITNYFPPQGKIAIKVHFGEPGNKFAFTPQFLKSTVNALKTLGLQPFLFDSPVSYRSPRGTKEGYERCLQEKGITPRTMGCPVIISNEGITVDVNSTPYTICSDPIQADGVLVLSHVKGHYCTGFGGALKNIGMGCVSKETKRAIHDGGKPIYTTGCQQCNQCVTKCPLNHIRLGDNGPCFDQSWCCGCSTCIAACEYGCLTPRGEVFDTALIQAVKLAVDRYSRVFYVNSLMNIMRLCDCVAHPGPRIADDVGVLFGTDIVAIDKASLDLIVETMGQDVFEKEHKKSPWVHIKIAEDLGLGQSSYSLKTIHHEE